MAEENYELTEKHLMHLSKSFYYAPEYLPENVQKIINGYCSRKISFEQIKEFLVCSGKLNVERAAMRFLITGNKTSPHGRYYLGTYGWREKDFKLYLKSFKSDGRFNPIALRHDKGDYILNFVSQHNLFPEFLEKVVDSKQSLYTNVKCGLIGWIIINNYHLNDKVLNLFLKGFFKGEEKVQIIKALIADERLDKLEIFWKSKSLSVQKILIEITPVKELPFLLATTNKSLLKLIEKRMQE